jgi:ubiquinone biosynthesis protein COQ4
MLQPPDTRLHPIAAFRALRGLLRNREDTRQAILLVDALRGETTLRQFDRFRETATGRTMLAERRSLLSRLQDRADLAQLPSGSLGRAYYDFMSSENLTADGLVEASRGAVRPTADEITWFRERNREMHDLLHVTAGYGRDPLGEACVLAFSYAQMGQRGFAVIASVVALRIAHKLREPRVLRAVYEAYRQGRHAEWLVGADWESLLEQPLDAVRARLQITPTIHYPLVLPALQRALAAAASPIQAAGAQMSV